MTEWLARFRPGLLLWVLAVTIGALVAGRWLLAPAPHEVDLMDTAVAIAVGWVARSSLMPPEAKP